MQSMALKESNFPFARHPLGAELSYIPRTPFHRLQLPCSEDPVRKIAVWRKRASQLLLISEHDVRV